MTLDLRLAVTDLVVGDYPIKVKCPDRIHKTAIGKLDKTNSLAVYPDHLHCYGCQHHRMGVWALADLLDVPVTEAQDQLVKYDSETLDAYRERAAQEANNDPLPESLSAIYHKVLMQGPRRNRVDWLYARGLDDLTIYANNLGHDGNRFVIPIYDDDKLVTLRFRRDDEYLDESYPKYSGVKGRNGRYLYPTPQVDDEVADEGLETLVLVEGELDALRLWQENIPALTVTNGAGQVPKMPALIRERWPQITTLVIATDMDEPGQAAADLARKEAEKLGFVVHSLTWEVGKDVSEALALGGLTSERIRTVIG